MTAARAFIILGITKMRALVVAPVTLASVLNKTAGDRDGADGLSALPSLLNTIDCPTAL